MRFGPILSALSDKSRKHPYYVFAPPYDSRSAGNRVLYALAEQLQMLGYPAFIVIHDEYEAVIGSDPGTRRSRYLTQAVAKQHFDMGLTPILVYPEITKLLSSCGVRVFYLLNYVGLMSGPARVPDCEYILAYSRNIAKRTTRVDGVIYIPVSDASYWCPEPSIRRDIVTVYAGKYVDEHMMPLPAETNGAVRIVRQGREAPTRDQIRELLRRSRRIYIYENTAIATEAVLCGCPVVYRPNRYFPELIAEHEHGLCGFTISGDPEEVMRATADLPAFRQSYLNASRRVPQAVSKFARQTQRQARKFPYTQCFEVRPLRREA